MPIETEIRSFISKEKFEELLQYFKVNATLIKEDNQETFYFDCEQDLRIQKNDFFAKIWLKKGKIHDDHREEIEIKFAREDFEKLEALFLALDYKVAIKWFRKRFEFKWDDVTVCLDYTKGYGHIIELEKMCGEDDKETGLARLKERLAELDVKHTPKDEFDERYRFYKDNWKTLI
ncbi:MAG: CYTH domain-containing protein [Patescibacteria group bacterium]